MERRDIEIIGIESRSGRAEHWGLFAARVPEADFDLDAAVELAPWRDARGADGMVIRRTYVVGRFQDRTLFAIITVPTYRIKGGPNRGKMVESEEYFRRVNDPESPDYFQKYPESAVFGTWKRDVPCVWGCW